MTKENDYIPDSVCICTPIYRDVNWRFFESLVRLLIGGLPDRKVIFKGIYNDSLVARARNIGTAIFLEPGDINSGTMPKCEWLMFIDSDIQFDPSDVERLLTSGKKLIGGLYAKKSIGGSWVVNTLKNEDRLPENDLFQVRYVGTGFMLIHRSVFEDMIKAYPEIHYLDDVNMARHNWHQDRWDFFQIGIQEYDQPDGGRARRYLSEDWFFCQRWMEMGGEVWVHSGVRLKHFGETGFPVTPFVDGCDMGAVNKIMKAALDRGEANTAEALQLVLEQAVADRKKLEKKD